MEDMTPETAESENLTPQENTAPQATQPVAPASEAPDAAESVEVARPAFDIRTVEPLSFAVLQEGRGSVFDTVDHKLNFRSVLEGLGTAGDEGRRRGLGWWVLGEYERCVDELANHDSDDTAAYTRARSLVAIGRFDEAIPLFERLTKAYPDEPRPTCGLLEAKVEAALADDPESVDEVANEIESEMRNAPGGFAESGEGLYILARISELRRDWETALDHYHNARALSPNDTALLRRFAHLAERSGLDELALQLYEQLVSLGGADRNVFINLGVMFEDMGRDSDAAACYDMVLRNDGSDELARMYLADARAAIEMFYDEDLEKKEDRLNQILRIPITDFELSVRARNCLNKMQITTLGDLVQRTEQELLSYKNFGETSLTEIKEILHSKGLRLGMPREEAVASIEAHANRSASGDRADLLNKPILELQLSIRARRTVETLGALTVGDITKHSAEELLGMPNFGQTSLQELRSKLGEIGVKLKGD